MCRVYPRETRVDEQNEHDNQIAAEIVDLTENDNNNLPESEYSYRVTPSGLVMEENKSPPRNKKKMQNSTRINL